MKLTGGPYLKTPIISLFCKYFMRSLWVIDQKSKAPCCTLTTEKTKVNKLPSRVLFTAAFNTRRGRLGLLIMEVFKCCPLSRGARTRAAVKKGRLLFAARAGTSRTILRRWFALKSWRCCREDVNCAGCGSRKKRKSSKCIGWTIRRWCCSASMLPLWAPVVGLVHRF